MKITHLFAAAAATALIGGAAYAQEAETPNAGAATAAPDQTATPAVDAPATAPASTDTAVNPTAADSAPAATDTAATVSSPGATGTTVNVTTLTNGPVADTPENRKLYQPLSNAGRRSAPKGN
jgi:hypothetical protein